MVSRLACTVSALALVAAAAACPADPVLTPCQTTADCPAGYTCSGAGHHCSLIDANGIDRSAADGRPDEGRPDEGGSADGSGDGGASDRSGDAAPDDGASAGDRQPADQQASDRPLSDQFATERSEAGPGDGPIADAGRSDATGADGAATQHNVVFVTSLRYAPAELRGQALADQACQTLAAGAGLPGTFVAWLSTSASNAIDRIDSARGWIRRDGRPFADTSADIAAGRIAYPLRLDENGSDIAAGTYLLGPQVLTGTHLNGTTRSTCDDWTTSGTLYHFPGLAAGGASSWSAMPSSPCTDRGHLYCFQTDHVVPLPPFAQSGRLAFVTGSTFTPGPGLDDADALCAAEASAAGRSGTFLALLAGDGVSAAARHVGTGVNWVRRDGVAVAASPADLLAGRWLAPIDLQASSAAPVSNVVWTGAAAVDQPGTTSSTCSNWSRSNLSGGQAGQVGVSNRGAFHVGNFQCSVPARLYCLQQ